MEVKDSREDYKPTPRHYGPLLVALIFIVVGLLLFGHNAGLFINDSIVDVVVSWQMLLIVIGLSMLLNRRSVVGGAVLIGVGGFFILPKLAGYSSVGTFWPLVFVMVGVVILISMMSTSGNRRRYYERKYCKHGIDDARYESNGGFINSSSNFNTVRHIVLDPVFKGAILQTTFGGTVLDLRKTELAEGNTYVEIECIFGGTEIYIPGDWNVIVDMQPIFGGVDDKRFRTGDNTSGRTLIIRGKVTFGGIDIKN